MISSLFKLFGFALVLSGNTYASTHNVSTKDSIVNWSGSKVVGGAHNGTMGVSKGEITWGEKGLVSGEIVIDMNKMTNLDISSEKYSKKLVGHLKSKDFFEVEKYPTAIFKTTKVQYIKDDAYMLWGKMTIKKTTKEIKFLVNMTEKSGAISGKGEIVLDRTDFDVRYGSGQFFENLGDKMIADEIKLGFEILAKK
jgi:polyisoprenoid-binding protein YceI